MSDAEKIEVTPEMISAGETVLVGMEWETFSGTIAGCIDDLGDKKASELLTEIYLAMWRASKRPLEFQT